MSEVDGDDFARLEEKVDKLAEAIQRLILIEERQALQGERIGKTEQAISNHDARLHAVDRKLDMWINRAMGVWGVIVTLLAVLEYTSKFFIK